MIIWLASYPKSGNTWVRAFIASYIYSNNDFKFEDLANIETFPSLNEISFLRKNLEIINLLIWLHIGIFFKLKLLKKKINFLKTHNALITIKNFAFTDIVKTLGLIYIIRDPRDIIISYSNHLNLSYEETFKRMKDLNTVEKTNDQLDRTLLSSWSNHYNSWKYFPSNKLIVRYEDLVTNPLLSFSKIIKYLNKLYELPISDEKIQSSIQNVEFKKLKNLKKKRF